MSQIHGTTEPIPGGATPHDILQHGMDTCAIKSQQIIMQCFGLDIPEEALTVEAMQNGYYTPGQGTMPDDVGRLLNDHGIPTHAQDNADVYDLISELSQGHKIIVGVDADELWRPSIFNDLFGEEANHALIVTGIDTTDADNIKVIITDPGSGDVAISYPLEQFVDAWHDSNCFYVATDAAPQPEFDPGMVNFDYDLGHITAIGNIPFDEYFPMLSEFNFFRDDIIRGMNECLDRINNPEHAQTIINDTHESIYDRLLNVEHHMQDMWSGNIDSMFDMQDHTHQMLYDDFSINCPYYSYDNFTPENSPIENLDISHDII